MTVMAGAGQMIIDAIERVPTAFPGGYYLVLEGALPVAADGKYCTVGCKDGKEESVLDRAVALARKAAAVVAVGSCACYGGIPASAPNPTDCRSMADVLKTRQIDTPLINVPGCPPHPDWITGSLALAVLYPDAILGLLDELNRPLPYFGKLIHENCPRRADFDAFKFAKKFGDPGCLYELGCKGPQTYADCPTRMWNSGVNWCVGAGGPCNGCVEPQFVDGFSPLFEKLSEERLERFLVGGARQTAPGKIGWKG